MYLFPEIKTTSQKVTGSDNALHEPRVVVHAFIEQQVHHVICC